MRALSGWPGPGSCSRLSGMTTTPDPYRGFRFPAEIISHAVWLYHCFSLSLREVELILAQRGIVVSYESIRAWGLRFGRGFRQLAQMAPAPARRQMAPGRGIHPDQRQAALPLVGGRPARQRARHPDPEPAQREGGQALLQEAAEGAAVRSPGDRDGQAAQLWCGQAEDPARGRAPPEPLPNRAEVSH